MGAHFKWRARNAAYHPETRPTVRKPKYIGRNHLRGKYWENPGPTEASRKGRYARAAWTRPLLHGLWADVGHRSRSPPRIFVRLRHIVS